MADYEIDGIELENVETLSPSKQANITVLPIIGSDSDQTETFDIDGAVRVIDVMGRFTGTESEIKTKIDNINALLSGDQSSSVTFTSPFTGNVQVKVMSFTVDIPYPGHQATYRLKVVEGN